MVTDQPRFIPLLAPPHRQSVTDAPVVKVIISGSVASGKRTLAKAIVGRAKAGVISEADARPLTIRTRESVLGVTSSRTTDEPREADYLVLIVDGTRASDLAHLSTTLSLLPLTWWRHTTVILTKTDLRTRAAFRPAHLHNLVASYSSSVPIMFSSPSNVGAIAQRVRRLALSSASGVLRPLEGLRVERPPRFVKAGGGGA